MKFHADGATYDPELDQKRLATLFERVKSVMQDGRWRTLDELRATCGGSEASISARLRDLRKTRFGSHTINRRRVAGGLYEYRLILNQPHSQQSLF